MLFLRPQIYVVGSRRVVCYDIAGRWCLCTKGGSGMDLLRQGRVPNMSTRALEALTSYLQS